MGEGEGGREGGRGKVGPNSDELPPNKPLHRSTLLGFPIRGDMPLALANHVWNSQPVYYMHQFLGNVGIPIDLQNDGKGGAARLSSIP